MPIDVEKLREALAKFRKYEETKIAGDGGGLDNFIHEDEVEAMLTEIEQLRAQVEEQRLELCRHNDAWCKTDEERKLRPR